MGHEAYRLSVKCLSVDFNSMELDSIYRLLAWDRHDGGEEGKKSSSKGQLHFVEQIPRRIFWTRGKQVILLAILCNRLDK